jgi:hypothetical protein
MIALHSVDPRCPRLHTDLAEGLRRTADWLSARDGLWQGKAMAP